jgi:hypothetical protein
MKKLILAVAMTLVLAAETMTMKKILTFATLDFVLTVGTVVVLTIQSQPALACVGSGC